MAVLFADNCFLEHETGTHPESADRLRSVYRGLKDSGLTERFEAGDIVPATREQLLRVHQGDHIDNVQRFTQAGGGRIDADTNVCDRSYDIALNAAGVAAAAVDQVLGGRHRRAVCLIRPPGHHALPHTSMGFCLFNNVAVAARQATDVHGLSRVLIVDWDVHHGNGTQALVEDDPAIRFIRERVQRTKPGTAAVWERRLICRLLSAFHGTNTANVFRPSWSRPQHAADRNSYSSAPVSMHMRPTRSDRSAWKARISTISRRWWQRWRTNTARAASSACSKEATTWMRFRNR